MRIPPHISRPHLVQSGDRHREGRSPHARFHQHHPAVLFQGPGPRAAGRPAGGRGIVPVLRVAEGPGPPHPRPAGRRHRPAGLLSGGAGHHHPADPHRQSGNAPLGADPPVPGLLGGVERLYPANLAQPAVEYRHVYTIRRASAPGLPPVPAVVLDAGGGAVHLPRHRDHPVFHRTGAGRRGRPVL